MSGTIAELIAQVDADRLREDLFYIAKDPLPFRKVNYTRPGSDKNSLEETEDFIEQRLLGLGYVVQMEPVQVQAFRCDRSKPKQHWYSKPDPSDPWYTACNVYGKKQGRTAGDEVIVVMSHKDSQSWIDSPGAYDNAVGVVGSLEIARILADYKPGRSIWFLFCNEEHWPWTSVTAAENARERGDKLTAIFNLDSLGGRPSEDVEAGRCTNVTLYTAPEGKRLADLMAQVNETYDIGLIQSSHCREQPGDDDGSFVKAGYLSAVANLGSYPYRDPGYHLESDTAEHVDIRNLRMSVQASLAAVLTVDASG